MSNLFPILSIINQIQSKFFLDMSNIIPIYVKINLQSDMSNLYNKSLKYQNIFNHLQFLSNKISNSLQYKYLKYLISLQINLQINL